MGDIIRIAADPVTVLSTVGGGLISQRPEFALDVSDYSSIDLQGFLLGLENPGDVDILLLTSMQNQLDDFVSPSDVGSWPIAAMVNASSAGSTYIHVPGASSPLLRYVRYAAKLNNGATRASFTLTGVGRRHTL